MYAKYLILDREGRWRGEGRGGAKDEHTILVDSLRRIWLGRVVIGAYTVLVHPLTFIILPFLFCLFPLSPSCSLPSPSPFPHT